jgi:hypothetical protein
LSRTAEIYHFWSVPDQLGKPKAHSTARSGIGSTPTKLRSLRRIEHSDSSR